MGRITGGRSGRAWRVVSAVAAAVLVAVSSGPAGMQRQESAGAARAAPMSEAADPGTALRVARAQGSRVEAVALRSPTRVVYAEPDGTMTAEVTARPVRAKLPDGRWATVDTTLVRRPDGTVGPRATTVPLSFAGGGTGGPLVRYGDPAHRIELSWPGPLPTPTLAGDTATYPDVLPGVDLQLRAEADGYAQYLVVRDRTAAANPKLRTVRLGLRTTGVTVRATRAGGLEARDGGGTVRLAAPVSRMWDAGAPRREATVGVAVERGALVLRPDRSLLADRATRYPVTIDPLWHTADKQSWTSVLSGNPGTAYWNSSGSPPWAQVGRCYEDGTCNGIGVARTYWQFDTSFLAGRLVVSADLRLTAVLSPSCGTRTHRVYLAPAAINSGTTWNNQPGQTGTGVDFTAPAVYTGCTGYKEVGVGVAGLVNRGGTTTFQVRAADENDQLAWRKYDNNAKLTVNFNRVPNVPTDLQTDPPLAAPCQWCAGVRYVGDDNVRLMATLVDPDGDQMQSLWNVNVGGTVYQSRSAFRNSEYVHSYTVGTDGRHGKAVEWAVKAEDTVGHGGDWAHGTRFVIDRNPPTVKPVVRATLYPADNRWHGGVGVPGRFVLESGGVNDNGVNDVDHYLWGWTDPPTNKVAANALGGTATLDLVPPGDGPRDLFVRSVDRAGHPSPTRQHHFYVRAGSGPLAQWSLDGNAEDTAFLGDRDGVVVGGVTYAPGAVGQAARFDGATTYVTPENAVRTDASFSVSAWVRLDSAGAARAAVSQSGTNFAGFVLWYRPENGGHWAFGMPRSDASYQGTDLATSAQPARTGAWTHLAGVYDAGQRVLRLYVDGVLAGTAARTVPDVHAAGRVQIGRTMWNGSPGVDHWPGLLDEVRVYDRVVTAEEVRAAVGTDDVRAGHWKLDEMSGTTGRNEAAGGEMVALHGDAAFTGDGDGDGLPDGGAVGGALHLSGDGHAATTGPAVHTDQAFTVATWVRLEQAPPVGQAATAVSQDGTAVSGFSLGYRSLASGGVWEFRTPSADAPDGQRPADPLVQSAGQTGTPTHLAAVYDPDPDPAVTTDPPVLRLYVDGVLVGTANRTGGFDATGALTLGRGRDGTPGAYWTGWVDEVRAYSRALSTTEIQAVVSRDDVALGEWRLDGNADPATGGPAGVLTGTPAWTGGQSDTPDPTDLALRLSGDDHVSLPHTVDVRQSFSVAAWAKLDQVGGTATVVSQDGNQVSAVQLQATPAGRWSFSMPSADAGSGVVDRVDGTAVQAGVWTHLVGVYDAPARQLSLYVNGVRAGTKAHHQTWDHAAGGMQIGAGLGNGTRLNRFVGAVDDVAVYGRTLFAEEIRAMAGRDLTLAHNWRLDEGSGTQAADAVGRHTANAAGGVTRVPGRLGNAVRLDGTDGRLATGGVDVRADADFTVAAWVHLDSTCPIGAGQTECKLVAVSLDGATGGASKFRLGHWRDRDQHVEGVWVFEMPEPDGRITKAAVPVRPSDFGTWVHLAGVYERTTGKLWLYVNGTRKGDGTLSQPWTTTGGVQIGRGRDAAGVAGQYFPGMVDDVRLYSGGLDDGRIGNLYNSYPVQCGTVADPKPCALPTAGAGRWRFDENSGTTVADSSGRGLTATMSGGADWTGGRIGAAGRFDGATGHARTAGPVLDTTGSYSISAWVYTATGTPTTNRVILAQSGDRASPFYLYQEAGGRWAAATSSGDSATPTLVTALSTERVWPGQWTHLGLVHDAGVGQLRLYVNGRLSAAQTGVTAWAAGGPLTVGLGRWGGSDDLHFPGGVDDVRAFGTALRDGEMSQVYADTAPTMLGNWTFDDQTVRDTSWRANPTTATGTVSYVDGPVGKALALAGTAAATSERPVVVPLSTSFTVSAWVRLTHEPAVQTVVAQDGTRMSGFALQYRPELDTWAFGAWTQDADAAEFTHARSRAPAVLGEWTHLTGVYDHAAGQLRLYVNGELAGSRDGVTLWPATGGLSIGRGTLRGVPAQHLTGEIDEVRVDLGIVPDSQIAQRAIRA
ncbi:LamG-like jellyroll fold domain-containing protein [Micromonospora sp. NBRC 101691]|uniref:LamG-like jellyroll fold domain-containing protein n=1 Tax=Micromonospora sp. NBRC 101691 TaxID=3032198 RepID=UPI0024A4F90C|nr:LamG-like jellyroll fold domain-containing protein [Micromonospora sp. NBRC 101691]GLY25099.1 hypothetical protein Misp04_48310 [Micromonospora sp. NBRC 101691]